MSPKYRVQVHVDDYWNYVVEAKDEQEARERAYVDFRQAVEDLENPTIEVEEVPDDTPLGDV
jgi:DNA polymerase/3'-5' exonuclease PolX